MTDYFNQSMEALQLAGMSKGTQETYTRTIRQLVEFCSKTPDEITEQDLKEYFLHRTNVDKWSPSTLRIAHSGIKFFFINVLKRDWHVFTYLNAKRERSLPCILSKEEVFNILSHVTTFHNYVFLSCVYACGLRLSEALNLHVTDIDSKRMMVHVHHGKGARRGAPFCDAAKGRRLSQRPLPDRPFGRRGGGRSVRSLWIEMLRFTLEK